jgi:hypothetical protein
VTVNSKAVRIAIPSVLHLGCGRSVSGIAGVYLIVGRSRGTVLGYSGDFAETQR